MPHVPRKRGTIPEPGGRPAHPVIAPGRAARDGRFTVGDVASTPDRGSSAERRWKRMEYESPEILASYSVEELTWEAAACQLYEIFI
jgi:hypothetical protein